MRIHDFCMKNTHCNTYAIYSLDTRCVLEAARWLGPLEKGDLCRSRCILLHPPSRSQSSFKIEFKLTIGSVSVRYAPIFYHSCPCVKYERQLCIMNGTPHANLVTRRRSQFTDDIGVITFDVLLKTSVI